MWVGGPQTVPPLIVLAVALFLANIRRKKLIQQKIGTRVEETHQEARLSLEKVLDTIPLGVFISNSDGICYVNKALKPVADAAPLDSILELIDEADRAKLKWSLDQVRAAGTPMTCQLRFQKPGCDPIEMECHSSPIVGKPGEVASYLVDVTHALNYERELQQKNLSVEAANEMLRSVVTDLERNMQATVQALVKAVEAKDPYTAGHSERVMAYALWIGEAMNLSQNDLRILRMGCLIHDIGKIGIKDSILTKPSGLTEEEFAEIKKHPNVGVSMLEGVPMFEDCIPIIKHHHERLNGTGYPDRLSGDQIPLLVRISTVADSFDAMTSTRAYRQGMSVEKALSELQKDVLRGNLDPKVVQVFTEIIEREREFQNLDSQAA